MIPSSDLSLAARLRASFGRITSSGQFIPEVDGLRFVAIVSVVFFHIHHYISVNNRFSYAEPSEFISGLGPVFSNGWRGVQLFFVISGFILALPFARQFLEKGRVVSLRQYYLRRVTRLEPPYLVAMTLCFLLIGYRSLHDPGFAELTRSFLASLVYGHGFFWSRDTLPLVNPVAWSLEIEVQFYVLAPLIAAVFLLPSGARRCVLMLVILVKMSLPAAWVLPHQSLLDFLDFFLMGFLLADLYVSGRLAVAPEAGLRLLLVALSLIAVWVCPARFLALPIGIFFYCCFRSGIARAAIANPWAVTIGGMCYSIYLIHWMLITTIGHLIVRQMTDYRVCDLLIQAALFAGAILVVGAVYFKLIERPCMSKDWHERLWARFKGLLIRVRTLHSPAPVQK